jgi:hypothetical protein
MAMLNLEGKTKPELQKLALELSIPLDGRMSEAGMREAINLHFSNQQAAGIIEEEKVKREPIKLVENIGPVFVTPAQVEQACAAYFASPHFVHEFLDNGQSYLFRARRNGEQGRGPWAEDTGTMAQPLSEIVKRAQMVSRGPIQPTKLDDSEFESFDRGKYTGTVLGTR